MSNYNVLITNRAKNDLVGIGDYITYTLFEPEIALNLIKGIRQQINKLSELPIRQSFIDDVVLASQGIRCLPYKNYYIFYQIEELTKTVFVLRIGYNRRNWKEILNPKQ